MPRWRRWTLHWTHEEGVTPLFTGIVLQQAEGTVEGPDRATVEVEALATFANSFIELSIVIEGDDATMSDPLSGNPAPVATSELPFELHNIGNTLSGILMAIQGPTYTSDETLDGVTSKGIAGSIAGAAIQPLIRRADAGLRQDIEVWVGEERPATEGAHRRQGPPQRRGAGDPRPFPPQF